MVREKCFDRKGSYNSLWPLWMLHELVDNKFNIHQRIQVWWMPHRGLQWEMSDRPGKRGAMHAVLIVSGTK